MSVPYAGHSAKKLLYFVVTFLLLGFFLVGRVTIWRTSEALPLCISHQVESATSHCNATESMNLSQVPSQVLLGREPVVFSLIMWSTPSAIEGALLIKTIIMYNSRPTDIHIICDDEAEQIIRSRIQLVTRPAHRLRVYYYKPTWQGMLDRIEREGTLGSDHLSGTPGLMKLFIQELLPPNVTRSIFVDTDALFIADPSLLWDVFATLQPKTAIVMGSHPEQNAPEWHDASRICSCVMLLDLQKLREPRLMASNLSSISQQGDDMATSAFKAMYGDPTGSNGRYTNVKLGDQGYWWAIVEYYKDLFEPLDYDFEVTSCLLSTYLTGLGSDNSTEEEENSRQIHTDNAVQKHKTVLPKLLHFNCLDGPIYMEWKGWEDPTQNLTAHWGSAVKYHNGYKWIWLNQGSGQSLDNTVEQFTTDNARFEDELSWYLAQEKAQLNTSLPNVSIHQE